MLSIIKNIIKLLCRIIRDLDNILSWCSASPFKHHYKIEGKCKKRGLCCKNIAIKFSSSLWKFYNLRRFYRFWYEFVYNFTYIKTENEAQCLLFKCNYLKNNTCSIYWKRPLICRRYPKVSRFGQPQFLNGCGFSVKQKSNEPK